MNDKSLSKTLVSLAIIKVNWDKYKKDYLDNFLPLLSTLFVKKNYSFIEETNEGISKLTEDFKNEFGLIIPFHPMISILNKAKKRGLINKNELKFLPTDEIYKYDCTDKMDEQAKNYEKVIKDFVEFSKQSFRIELSTEDAENTLLYFLKRHDLEILFATYEKSTLPEVRTSKQNLFIFSKFVQSLYITENYSLFKMFLNVVIGHILANVVLYGAEFKDFVEPKLKELNIYLDTRLILRLLGTEGKEIKDIYISLLKDFKTQGLNLFIFSHTYEEIMSILQGCLTWIEKPAYDSAKASITLKFFKSQGSKESDVELFINSLDNVLNRNDIKKVGRPNYSDYSQYQIDEKKMQDIIMDVYNYNPEFQLQTDEKTYTIQKDMCSISAIYLLRKGQKPANIKQAKHIFVTTNSSLAYATKRFETEIEYGEGFYFPACVTDTFIGTLIWLRNPNKAVEISQKKIIGEIYSALQPSEELVKQYISEIEKSKESGDITEDDYILLRDSQVAKELLSERTLGDPERFTPKTPNEILDVIKSEAYTKYQQEKTRHEKTKKKLEEEREKEKTRSERLDKRAEKVANVSMIALLIIFTGFTIFSWLNIQGLIRWIISSVLLLFAIASLCGLKKITFKRWVKKLILSKIFGVENDEHGV